MRRRCRRRSAPSGAQGSWVHHAGGIEHLLDPAQVGREAVELARQPPALELSDAVVMADGAAGLDGGVESIGPRLEQDRLAVLRPNEEGEIPVSYTHLTLPTIY